MYELNAEYLEQLETLAAEIQESDELAQYLEEEEEELFQQLKELFEPRIAAIYEAVAEHHPLQIIPLELVLIDPSFEGLYLPKILGYTVLRGEIDQHYSYLRPQDHFKEVLLAICNSSNFEILKKRIGQSIQIGFALSSDIWITNLINSLPNKRVRYFLQSQKLEKYRRENERIIGYQRYKRQFEHDNFLSAQFPETTTDITLYFGQLKHFLIYRLHRKSDNSTLMEPLRQFVANKTFYGTVEHLQTMVLFATFFDLSKEDQALVSKHFNEVRKTMPDFENNLLRFILELHKNTELDFNPACDRRLSDLVDPKIKDDIAEYFQLMDTIHSKGYINVEVQEAVRDFYNRHEGLSLVNECVRQTVYHYFATFINNLEENAYLDFFDISKVFAAYKQIFLNQQFNQRMEDLSMDYVQRLLHRFTDKRGKDYQDIKRFIASHFLDYEFLTEKEMVEMFKTRRKKKKED